MIKKILNNIQDELTAINAHLALSSTTEDEKIDIMRELDVINALSCSFSKNHEKDVKKGLEILDIVDYGSYKYYYDYSTRKSFDLEKVKDTLIKCQYNVDDFYYESSVKKLKLEIKK